MTRPSVTTVCVATTDEWLRECNVLVLYSNDLCVWFTLSGFTTTGTKDDGVRAGPTTETATGMIYQSQYPLWAASTTAAAGLGRMFQ